MLPRFVRAQFDCFCSFAVVSRLFDAAVAASRDVDCRNCNVQIFNQRALLFSLGAKICVLPVERLNVPEFALGIAATAEAEPKLLLTSNLG